jgi:hypothetical protein
MVSVAQHLGISDDKKALSSAQHLFSSLFFISLLYYWNRVRA